MWGLGVNHSPPRKRIVMRTCIRTHTFPTRTPAWHAGQVYGTLLIPFSVLGTCASTHIPNLHARTHARMHARPHAHNTRRYANPVSGDAQDYLKWTGTQPHPHGTMATSMDRYATHPHGTMATTMKWTGIQPHPHNTMPQSMTMYAAWQGIVFGSLSSLTCHPPRLQPSACSTAYSLQPIVHSVL